MEIKPSARRHGINDEDIRHALRNARQIEDHDDIFIAIGGDRSGRLLEIGFVERDDEVIVIHAMPARPKHLR